jgi:hypothetical protein
MLIALSSIWPRCPMRHTAFLSPLAIRSSPCRCSVRSEKQKCPEDIDTMGSVRSDARGTGAIPHEPRLCAGHAVPVGSWLTEDSYSARSPRSSIGPFRRILRDDCSGVLVTGLTKTIVCRARHARPQCHQHDSVYPRMIPAAQAHERARAHYRIPP